MQTRSVRGAILAVAVAATLAAGPAALAARVDTFPFRADKARLAADRHIVVVSGTYTCGPLDLSVVGGGGTVDLTVRQGEVDGFGGVQIEVCDGTAQSYQTEVTTFGEPTFERGGAVLLASGLVHGERDGEPVDLQPRPARQRITLSRG
jgi:hypothetical protein